jgi:hypothetical protein
MRELAGVLAIMAAKSLLESDIVRTAREALSAKKVNSVNLENALLGFVG